MEYVKNHTGQERWALVRVRTLNTARFSNRSSRNAQTRVPYVNRANLYHPAQRFPVRGLSLGAMQYRRASNIKSTSLQTGVAGDRVSPQISPGSGFFGASWQSRLDDRQQNHSHSYASKGIVQNAQPDCSKNRIEQSVMTPSAVYLTQLPVLKHYFTL